MMHSNFLKNIHPIKSALYLLAPLMSLLLISACRDTNDSLDIPGRDTFIWSMELDNKAVVMSTEAPYNSIKLTPRIFNIRGEKIDYEREVIYMSASQEVEVSSDGTVTALKPVSNLRVTATTTSHNVTLVDTAMITVMGTSPTTKLHSFSIQRLAGDSAKVAMSSFGVSRTKSFAARVLNSEDLPISPSSVFYKVSDPSIATINRSSGLLTANRMGEVMVYAFTNVFGIAMADSLKVTVGPPLLNYVTVLGRIINSDTITSFTSDSIQIGVGGTVRWTNASKRTVNVVFDDPGNVSGLTPGDAGNIPDWGPIPPDTLPVRQRIFNVPGVFKYKSSISGGSGVIVVK